MGVKEPVLYEVILIYTALQIILDNLVTNVVNYLPL